MYSGKVYNNSLETSNRTSEHKNIIAKYIRLAQRPDIENKGIDHNNKG